jgi:hypothetical protein
MAIQSIPHRPHHITELATTMGRPERQLLRSGDLEDAGLPHHQYRRPRLIKITVRPNAMILSHRLEESWNKTMLFLPPAPEPPLLPPASPPRNSKCGKKRINGSDSDFRLDRRFDFKSLRQSRSLGFPHQTAFWYLLPLAVFHWIRPAAQPRLRAFLQREASGQSGFSRWERRKPPAPAPRPCQRSGSNNRRWQSRR